MSIAPTDYIPLAMLNALAYCARRFGYEYIQAEMLLNDHVVEGQIRHSGVDLVGTTWLPDVTQERRVYVWSERLRVAGFCDLVEYKQHTYYPVEYKKGRLNRWRNDHVQLCAQAICLEERMGIQIERGYIFSFAQRRREEVAFSAELRSETAQYCELAQQLAARGQLPPPTTQRAKCPECSLQPLCLPSEIERLQRFPAWETQL